MSRGAQCVSRSIFHSANSALLINQFINDRFQRWDNTGREREDAG